MLYGKGFVETDDVDWWFLRSSSSSCAFSMVSLAVPVFIFFRFPQALVGLWVRSRGGLRRSGDIGGGIPGFLLIYGSWGITSVGSLSQKYIAHSGLSLVSVLPF